MTLVLSPQKVILLAVQLAANSDIDDLACLTSQHPKVLHKDLVLRILLTYLPETTPSSEYTSFLQELASGELVSRQYAGTHVSDLGDITDDEAARRVRKLHLLQLAIPDARTDGEDDSITIFLFRRAYRVDEEAGMLTQLPSLLTPFLAHTPDIRTWMLSSLLPLLRRNYEYYANSSIPYTLAEFQRLPDAVAVTALLSQTGANADYTNVGRDLRGLVGPWLHNDARWLPAAGADESFRHVVPADATDDSVICPGWERMLDWLLAHASQSWNVSLAAVKQWDGPEDVDLGDADSWLREEQLRYLERRYARAVLGCAYLIPDTSSEAFEAAYEMVNKTMDLLGEDDLVSLQTAVENLPSVPVLDPKLLSNSKNTTWMRDGLLNESNPLTTPSSQTTHLLQGLILSAFLLSRRGIACTVKRAGDLLFVQDEREQRSQAAQLIHELASSISNKDDESWVKARKEILWLRDWGAVSDEAQHGAGIFGRLSKEFLEAEILKALLPNGSEWFLTSLEILLCLTSLARLLPRQGTLRGWRRTSAAPDPPGHHRRSSPQRI
jgi:protein transport protein SEC39